MDDRSFSEIISELQVLIEDVALLAKESDIEREILSGFSLLAEKFRPILNDLRDDSKVKDTRPIRKAIQSLDKEFLRAKNLIKSPNSRAHITRIGSLTRDIGRSLGLVLLARLDVSADIKEKIGILYKELMNPGFASSVVAILSPSSGSRFDSESEFEEEEEEMEDEIVEVEERRRSLGIEDVVLQVKYGDDEGLKLALFALRDMIDSELVNDEWIHDQAVVPILINRLGSSMTDNRLPMVQTLRKLASSNPTHKEKMADIDSLSVLVRSLAWDVEERREAVSLLLSLSDLSPVRRRIGRIQGCIVMLVAILNGDDLEASHDAGKLLNALSSNTQNALHMAEAGYFKPLVHCLEEGSDMCKILMAAALSRMELTDQSKASLGEDGAIDPLVKMFIGGKLEAKLSSLSALQNLSSLTENTQRLVTSGIVPPLLQLLFSVTSVLMTLREPASAILARIAQSESVLVNPDVAQQMLSLLNLSSPVIQLHLLQALYNITMHPGASKVKRKMKENGAIQLLLPFLSENNLKIRLSALKLFYVLSKDSSLELTEQLGESYIKTMVNIIISSVCEEEKAAAIGILSNLPVSDKKATDAMKKLNLLSTLMSIVGIGSGECSQAEGIAGILIRFTVSSDRKLQHYAVEHGVIPFLVEILSSGSLLAKARAATALAQLSQNTYSLRRSRKSMWLCMPPSSEAFCDVHDSYCFVRTTFCLVKASAISPLIQILEGNDRGADEVVIDALATLVKDETWENGSNCLVKMSAVPAIIKVIQFGNAKAQEKALLVLETIFRNEEHRKQYGESAQVVLIDLAQRVDSRLKSIVARVLAQLELLQMQSSYF